MKCYLLLFSIWLLFFLPPAFSQDKAHVTGELLIQFDPETDPDAWSDRWQTFGGAPTNLSVAEQLSPTLHIWRMTFDPTAVPADAFLRELRQKDPNVRNAQRNHLLRQRATTPNDPLFSDQWQYVNTGLTGGEPDADLDADQAWDITTGGLTALGDTIVVCVIDDGLDPSHEDFGDNIWINHAEIPDNGIDDDQNGYVDDYRGWNARRENDRIDETNTHGTPVAGIIGARGNNGLGVSGLNWNVKLMIVVGGINASLESDYIKAFEYPLRQRRLYNETDGKKGALVVATNGSWGVDKGQLEDFPLWSAIYDTLGAAGILNVGAVTNNDNTDIDQDGDMPAASPSPYLISVTNIDFRDQKVDGAGYGATSVDLAAYGGTPETGVWTTKNNNGYGAFPGTSAAAPHVAGAIGLLYSTPCGSFASLARTDPGGAAAIVRDVILDGAQPVPALAGLTATGGRLNVFNSLQLLLQECTDCFPASTLSATEITTASALLSWNQNDSITRVDLRWRETSTAEWTELNDVQAPYLLDNLLACTDYEFQLNSYCGDTELGYGESLAFRTDGCCSAPRNFRTIVKQEDRFFVRWDPVTAAEGYEVRLRAEDAEPWDTIRANRDGSFAISQLSACTRYELQARTLCTGENSEFSDSHWIRTLGCGFCIDEADLYCDVDNVDGSEEWIARLQLHTLDQTSNGSTNGYQDFTGLETVVLRRDAEYDLIVTPGFAGTPRGRYTEVFIDYNQDGIFSSAEKVFDSERSSEAVGTQLGIPGDALLGITRMRVSMLAKPNIGACPSASDQIGEVEDYCVRIDPATPIRETEVQPLRLILFPNPFQESFTLRTSFPAAEPRITFTLTDALGRPLRSWTRTNLPAGSYEESIPAAGLSPGVYWLIMRGERSGRLVRRIVKQ